MKRDGRWLSSAEIEQAAGTPGVLTGVVVDAGESQATHADLFVAPGHEVNRVLLARPPKAQRIQIGAASPAIFTAPAGKYTIYALPKRLDPTYRQHFPALPPVTMAITIAERPTAQEFRIRLG
jgi:hypothetical protein